jgi:hypothetical protein
MQTLIFIGIAIAVITTLLVIVDRMAEGRGRNQWAWVIAAFIGLWFAFIGWVAVVAALVFVGHSDGKRHPTHRPMTHAHGPGRP